MPAAAELFALAFNGSAPDAAATVLAAADAAHVGTSLQSADLTAVWTCRTLLARDFSSVGE